MSTRWQTKRDTAANWTNNDPVLLNGEIGYETDTNKMKFGDGSTAWTNLDYFGADRSLSAYTNLDSESNAMERSHAYLAMTDGAVYAYGEAMGQTNHVQIYVGNTDDPFGAGTLISQQESDAANSPKTASVLVAEGEYFEVRCSVAAVINWKSFGILSASVDQD